MEGSVWVIPPPHPPIEDDVPVINPMIPLLIDLYRYKHARCHDAGHDCFKNTSNVRRETAPGILFTHQAGTF
jgi:hypothetical protein